MPYKTHEGTLLNREGEVLDVWEAAALLNRYRTMTELMAGYMSVDSCENPHDVWERWLKETKDHLNKGETDGETTG